ncbi:MAG: response regulator [Sedimentisphaerales bacterium]|nr:response regulator [Sedimentisphaerales bacterium]
MSTKTIKKVFAVVIVLALISGVCLLAWMDVKNFEDTIVSQTQEHLLNIAKSEAQNLEEMFQDLQSKLQMLAKDPRVQKSILTYDPVNKPFDPEGDSPGKGLFEQLATEINNIYCLDTKGIVQSRIPYKPNRIGMDLSEKPGIKYVIENQTSYISDIFEVESGYYISVCSPVFKDDNFIGILGTLIHLEDIQQIVDHVITSNNGYTWILNDQGNIIYHRNRELIGKNILDINVGLEGDEEDEEQERKVVENMVRGYYGSATFVYDELSADKTIMSWIPAKVGERSWSVVVCAGYREVAGPIRAQIRNVFLGGGMCLILLISIATAYYRTSKKKSRLESQIAIGKVNDELQQTFTEQKKLSGELENQRKLLNDIISNAPLYIFWKDSDSVYQNCNNKFAEVAGFSRPEDIIGKTDLDLNWNEDHKLIVKVDKEIMKSGIPLLNVERNWSLPNGSTKVILSNDIPLHNDQGAISGVLGVYIDITGVKAVQKNVKLQSERLQDILSSIDEGILAIDGLGRIVEANPYFSDLTGKDIDELKGSMVEDVLDESLSSKINKYLDDFQIDNESGDNSFECEINNTNFEVKLYSLYKNNKLSLTVIKLSDISRYIELRTNTEKAIAKTSHELRTLVSGISGFAELLQHEELTIEQAEYVNTIHANSNCLIDIFDKTIEEAVLKTEKDKEGTKEIAMKEKPEPTKSYPAQPRKTIEDPVKEEKLETILQGSGHKGKLNILLVDDVEENRLLAGVMLGDNNYKITSCVNGKEAVEHAEKEKFDLILMDIQMPVMGGQEAAKLIRKEGINAKTAIIAMTASSTKEDELNYLNAGFDDVIIKPIKKEILLRKVERYMGQAKQMRSVENGEDVVSFLTENPDYTKTIEMFIDNLPKRIEEMQSALNERDLQDLSFKVHALKGLGGFAGFPIYTEKAKTIEQMISDNQIDNIQEQIDELSKLCRRTKQTGPPK